MKHINLLPADHPALLKMQKREIYILCIEVILMLMIVVGLYFGCEAMLSTKRSHIKIIEHDRLLHRMRDRDTGVSERNRILFQRAQQLHLQLGAMLSAVSHVSSIENENIQFESLYYWADEMRVTGFASSVAEIMHWIEELHAKKYFKNIQILRVYQEHDSDLVRFSLCIKRF